jgi:hypothetical protein
MVLSPVLFCIYFDGIIREFEITKFGCHIGFSYVGGLAYTDDLVLWAPKPRMQQEGWLQLSMECYSFIYNTNKPKWML